MSQRHTDSKAYYPTRSHTLKVYAHSQVLRLLTPSIPRSIHTQIHTINLQMHLSPNALTPKPNILRPPPNANANLGSSFELQRATDSLPNSFIAHAAQTPIYGQARRGRSTWRYGKRDIVDDPADGLGLVVVGRRVYGVDGDGGVWKG